MALSTNTFHGASQLRAASEPRVNFSSLPQELKIEIWKIAIEAQRTERRILCIAPDPNFQERTLEKARRAQLSILKSTRNHIPVPSLLHICHYTRVHALPQYELWPLADEDTYIPFASAKIYVNKEFDTFIFHNRFRNYWFLDTIIRINLTHDINDEARSHFLFQTAGIQNYAFDQTLLLDIFQMNFLTHGPTLFFNAFKSYGTETLNITILIQDHNLKEYVGNIQHFKALVPGTFLRQCAEELVAGLEEQYTDSAQLRYAAPLSPLVRTLQERYHTTDHRHLIKLLVDSTHTTGEFAEYSPRMAPNTLRCVIRELQLKILLPKPQFNVTGIPRNNLSTEKKLMQTMIR